MEDGKPSATAIISAMGRAAHLLWDQPPKVFKDTLALQLSGCESEAALKAQIDQLDGELARTTTPDFALKLRRTMTAQLVMRSRYLEDEVDEAVRRGVSQYVILGAGLDSFAYRRSELATALHTFEVDHPATQAWKRTRLRAAGIELPAHLSLVAVDFERESLIDNLRMSGYRTVAPSLFSWLGVTMYLSTDAIFGTLEAIAALAAGTEIIFEYSVPKDLVDAETQKMLAVVLMAAQARGEPQTTFFEPAKLAEQVRKVGFAEVTDFGPDEATARYFTGRTDGLRLHSLNHYMRARVGPRST
ncbi:MAG TPA: SAM-dependent methyltransferase [Candidatus Binataceae bacterium]|nr:SAM-dependent methyltransferase [Candidatus Binataceae bacterium]